MIVARLDLANVRNIESLSLELAAGVNLLIGPNGAGKTAVLEALHLLFRGRSFRGRADTVVRRGENELRVQAVCQHADLGTLRIAHRRERGRGGTARQDGRPARQSEIAALLPLQPLLPDLANLVFGGPGLRRQWLDWGTFHMKHTHLGRLRSYLRALRHRNALLRTRDLTTLAGWTEQVVDHGTAVATARNGYFERVSGMVESCLAQLLPEVAINCSIHQGWPGADFAEALAQQHTRDVRSGTTNSGPHRADVVLQVDGDEAAAVLSRGQGKALASALRLGQAERLLADSASSLFLIDDVGAELDSVHSERFYARLDGMNCQIVAASAQAEVAEVLTAKRRGMMFHVKQGRIVATEQVRRSSPRTREGNVHGSTR